MSGDTPGPDSSSGIAPTTVPAATTGGTFAKSASGVLFTRVMLFGLALLSTYLMARLLGTAGRGLYGLTSAYAGLVFVLSQLGLPSAFTYFTARGFPAARIRSLGLRVVALVAVVVVALGLLTMPALQGHGLPLQGVPTALVVLALVLGPIQLLSSTMGAILYGVRRFRRYNLIQIAQAGLLALFIALLVGVAGLEVTGAVLAVIASQAIGATLVIREVAIVARAERDGVRVPVRPATAEGGEARAATSRSVLGYALRLYPSLVPSYFSYRQDVLLLGAFAVPTSQIGLYGVAVNFAEMLFYIPDSISTVLYPVVAGSSRADADRRALAVTRFTVLVTVLAAIALVPATYIALRLLLPDFEGSMPAFLVILPAVVSLTVSKVLSSYVAGLGRPGPVTAAAIVSMVVNLAANVVLIPRLGIVGASASSLISYSTQAVLLLAIASGASHRPPWAFVTPGRAELAALRGAPRFVWSAVRSSIARRSASSGSNP